MTRPSPPGPPAEHDARLPRSLVAAVIGASLLPGLLLLLGVDLSSRPPDLDGPAARYLFDHLEGPALVASVHSWLAGSFVHTLLEWTALCIAVLSALLAFAHARVERDATLWLIGVALLSAGSMDAFHALAADYLMPGQVDPVNFLPFTWAISRLFRVLILFVGVAVLLERGPRAGGPSVRFLVLSGAGMASLAYGAIQLCATYEILPNTTWPDAVVARPFDALALVLYALGGAVVFPRLYRQQPSLFTHALVVGCVPEVVTQLHAAFGSRALFDSHFVAAHLVKNVAYLVPFVGLLLQYLHALQRQRLSLEKLEAARGHLLVKSAELYEANEDLQREIGERARIETRLREQAQDLQESNKELQDFAYIASHDLNEPLRKVIAFGDRLVARAGDRLEDRERDYLQRMQRATRRMQTLIADLLELSRVTTRGRTFERLSLGVVARGVVSDLEAAIERTGGRVELGELPFMDGDRAQLRQLLQNLIANGLKFHRPDVPPVVSVRARLLPATGEGDEGARVELSVADNGIGFEEKYLDRIFQPFQRLHARTQYEGTGIGLAVVRKIVKRHRGTIRARSAPGEGATFVVTMLQFSPDETEVPDDGAGAAALSAGR